MRTSPERRETIRAVLARGGTLAEAGRLLGMQTQHVWRIARNMGLTKPQPKQGRPRKWSDEGMLLALQNLAKRLGRVPTRDEVGGRSGCPHATSYIERFGSWPEALRRIGLRPRAKGENVRWANQWTAAAERAAEIRAYWQRVDPSVCSVERSDTAPHSSHGLSGWVHPYARRSA